MRRALSVFAVLLLLAPLPAYAQSLAQLRKEAEIKSLVPFAQMRAEIPGLTMRDYDEAIRALARQELGLAQPSRTRRPSLPPAPRPWSQTTSTIRPFEFSSSSDGVTGTSQRIGNTTFYNDSTGANGTSTTLEPFTFYRFTQPTRTRTETATGTTTTIGETSFHNLSNGVTGTSTQIGNTTFHNFSNGTSCTSTTIGTSVFTNCNK
jgi:hypothetical protein